MNERTNETNIATLKPLSELPALRDTSTELAVAYGAASAKAAVEARYVMALRQPRHIPTVREKILEECRRPGFAEVAWYVKPIGDGVEGLSIRFAEAAMRCYGNVMMEAEMLYEDIEKELHRVTVTDLESNLTYPLNVPVSKLVERSRVPDGQKAIRQRTNSWGKTVFTVIATEDELANKRNAAISKAIRTLALRVFPGDIQDDCTALIKQIRSDKSAQDPRAEQKKIADSFNSLNVPVAELVKYLGHELNSCSPAELVKLRALYTAIKDGEATWAEAVENAERSAAAKPVEHPVEQPKVGELAAVTETPVEQKVDIMPAAANEEAPRRRRASAAIE
jgi:hypothetical protein